MTWLASSVMLLVLALASPSAFGQMATTSRHLSHLHTSAPPYDTNTPEGYREWAIWQTADECTQEFHSSWHEVEVSREVYSSYASFRWQFRNRRNTEDGFTLVSACGDRHICDTEPPFRNVEFSCAQLRLPHQEYAVPIDNRGLPTFYTQLPAGYSQYGERPGT